MHNTVRLYLRQQHRGNTLASPGSGALTKFDISGNSLRAEGTKLLAVALEANQVMTELNISSNAMTSDGQRHGADMSGVATLADAISGMGALMSLHVGKNRIPEKEVRQIMVIAMRMDSMKILCEIPFKDKTLTELDVSGKDLGMEGALVVTEYLDGNGALTSLNLSSNSLRTEGAKIVAEAIKVTSPNYAIAAVLAPFSCPSDHWLN
jgi:Ran GTPase-activating protein (RanGAP) involved in mRNA processing and transport